MKTLIVLSMLFCMSVPRMAQAECRKVQLNVGNTVDVRSIKMNGWRYKSHRWVSQVYGNERPVLWNGTPHRVILYRVVEITYYRRSK